MIDIPALIKEAHETSISKGWWEKENPFDAQVANFHSEVSEAWEEYRKGKPLDEIYYTCECCSVEWKNSEEAVDHDLNIPHRLGKPEGFTVELADLLIRLADSAGHYGWHFTLRSWQPPIEDVDTFICSLHRHIAGMGDGDLVVLNSLIEMVIDFCTTNNLPLERALAEKLAYNKTRSHRHGGKVA